MALESRREGGGLGTIYVLSNADRTWSKVGRTSSGSAAGRAASYGKTHGYKWTVHAQFMTMRVSEVEANIHGRLRSLKIETWTGAKEIFKISPAKAEAVARSMILLPGTTDEERLLAIRKHVRGVRAKLRAQEDYLRYRNSRSSIGGYDVIEREIYPQHVVLDALERDITVEEMMDRYRRLWMRREAERKRLQTRNELLYQDAAAVWRAKGLMSKLADWFVSSKPTDRQFNQILIDETLFPSPPHYATETLCREQASAAAAARRAANRLHQQPLR